MTLAVTLAVIIAVTFQTMTLHNTVLGVVGAAIITLKLKLRATVTVNPNAGVEGIGKLNPRATVTVNPNAGVEGIGKLNPRTSDS